LGECKRILVFLHPEKKLGGVTVVSGDSVDPVTVKLQPLGAVEGTVLDGDGKPWAGLRVKVRPAELRDDYDNLGYQQRDIQGNFSIYRGLPNKFLSRDVTTDKEGRFRVDGVLPGVDFDVYVSDGDLTREGTLVVTKNRVRVEAGKATDLRVLKKGDNVKGEGAGRLSFSWCGRLACIGQGRRAARTTKKNGMNGRAAGNYTEIVCYRRTVDMATLQLRTLLRRIEQMSGDARETYG